MTSDLASLVDDVLERTDATTEHDAVAAASTTYVDAVRVDLIHADHSYQRPLDKNRVNKMAAEFDPSLVGVIDVSLRADGSYAVVEGQHRLAVVRAVRGAQAHIACNIHTGLTREQEAQLFFDMDRKRRRLTGWDRWNARRGAGEQAVLDIEKVVVKHGLKVHSATLDRHVRCVAACEKLVDYAGLNVLDETLGLIVAAYEGSADSLRAEIVHGLGLVLAWYDHDELDRQRILDALAGIVPRQLAARAAALRETQSGQLPRLTAQVIVERINAQPGKKLEAFAKRVPAGSRHAPTHRDVDTAK